MTSIEIHHTDAEKQSGSSSPAERHTFIPKQVIDTAWTTFKKYRKILLVLLAISFLPGLISGIIEMILLSLPATSEVVASQYSHMPERVLLAPWDMIVAIINGVSQIAGLWLGLGLIKAELLLLEDQKPHYSIITSASGMQVVQGVIATAVVTLCTLLGLLLFVFPGIYIMLRLSFYNYYVAQGYSAMDSIKASWHATKGQLGKIMIMGFAYFGISLLGLLVLGIGLIVSIAVISLAHTIIYKSLKPNTPANLQPRYV